MVFTIFAADKDTVLGVIDKYMMMDGSFNGFHACNNNRKYGFTHFDVRVFIILLGISISSSTANIVRRLFVVLFFLRATTLDVSDDRLDNNVFVFSLLLS